MSETRIIEPKDRDLGGGFLVRRLLPAMAARSVGPFVFFDHMGPITARPEDNHDVRPHPHIGLATVTYLYEGAMMHRDSTGAEQRIEPGAINWMTAGRGVVHSERTPEDLRSVSRRSQGLQLWAALPAEDEEIEPSFSHTAAEQIPERRIDGGSMRLLIGEAAGLRSPVPTRSPTLYVALALEPGASVSLDFEVDELAVYAVDQPLRLDDTVLPAHRLGVLPRGRGTRLFAPEGGRVAILGGRPVGPRFLWWNFVSSRRERIVQAAEDWQADRMGRVAGDPERIELPDRPLPRTADS